MNKFKARDKVMTINNSPPLHLEVDSIASHFMMTIYDIYRCMDREGDAFYCREGEIIPLKEEAGIDG